MNIATDAAAPVTSRGSLVLPLAVEPVWKVGLYGAIAATFVVLYFLWLSYYTFFNAAHAGVDQNGYLVGGKMMADHWTTGFSPSDIYQFVGRMWVGSAANQYLPDTPTFYPKYPIGLPAIYALLLKVGGAQYGQMLCFFVSPVCMSLAIGMTYLLVRMVLGSFAGLLGMIVVATSQVTLGLMNNPNSHASTLFCVTAGFYLLLQWWEKNGLWRAVLAGLLLGYAVTIRYTEGLLVLPMMLVALFNLRPKDRFSWRDCVFLGLSWLVPVIILVSYNLWHIGTMTGYDPCNESTGFRFEYMAENWDTMLRHLANAGLFFIFPFSIFGMFAMFRWNWKIATLIMAWVLPSILVYTAYYWAPDGSWIGYARFYLTILPALALAAIWTLMAAAELLQKARPFTWRSIAIGAGIGLVLGTALGAMAGYSVDQTNLANKVTASLVLDSTKQFMAWGAPIGVFAGIIGATYPLAFIVAIGAVMGVFTTLPTIERDALESQAMYENGQMIQARIPAGSTVFGEERFFNYLQFAGDYKLYTLDIFNRNSLARMQNVKLDEPNGLQPQRAKDLWERVKNKSDKDLVNEQNRLMAEALGRGERVFFVSSSRRGVRDTIGRFIPGKTMETRVVANWNESKELNDARTNQRSRLRGGFGGMMLRPPGGLRGGSDGTWQIIEVGLRPPGR